MNGHASSELEFVHVVGTMFQFTIPIHVIVISCALCKNRNYSAECYEHKSALVCGSSHYKVQDGVLQSSFLVH